MENSNLSKSCSHWLEVEGLANAQKGDVLTQTRKLLNKE